MKRVVRTAAAVLLAAAAVHAAEPIAFARYQTIIDRQPFGQPPPGFNPQQMASEVTKGGAAAAGAELTAQQQELQKVVGFSVLNLSGDDCWVGISVPSAGDPKVPSHYYMKVGDTRDGWFVKSADPIKKTAVIVKDDVELELTLGTPFSGGAGANAKGAAAKTARTAGPSAPVVRSGLLARRGADQLDGAAAAPTSFVGRRARRNAEVAALAAEMAARDAEQKAREEEAKARAEEERAAREAERAEQRQQLMDIREELRKSREEKEKQRAAAEADAAAATEAATDENDES